MYTDIDQDGMEVGPNVTETVRLAREGGLPVTATGGVRVLTHLERLAEAAAPSLVRIIVDRALHEECFTLDDALRALVRSERPA